MFKKLRNNIEAIILIAILGLILMGATYVNLGPTSLIDGDIGVTAGHSYYIGDELAVHTQNTDTGTTSTTFQIDSGNSGPKIKNNAGTLEVRNEADDAEADLRALSYYGDGSNLTDVGSAESTALTIAAKAAENIDKGLVVYISGATGQIPEVSIADNTDGAKHLFLGVAAETKTTGQTILIRVRGELINVDTSTFSDGNILYLTTGGGLTATAPTSGAVEPIGYCSYSHVSAGKIIVMHHSPHSIYVPSGDDIVFRMGDSIGSNTVKFKNYADVQLISIDSYGRIWHTVSSTAVTGDITGLRTIVTSSAASGGDAPTGQRTRAIYAQVVVADGKHAGLLQAGLFTASAVAGNVTAYDVHVLCAHYSSGASTVIGGDLYVGYLRAQTRSTDSRAVTGFDVLLALENEAIEGAGAVMDSAIRIFDTNVGGSGFTYGIDMDDAVMATADIRFSFSHTLVDSATGIAISLLSPTTISGLDNVTSTDADYILIWDDTDSTLKKCDMGEVRVAGAGYTNLTEFVDQNTWKVFYSDGSGDVIELALGADGTYLESKGAAAAPEFSVPAGAGDVVKVGTPADNQVGVWTGDGTIEGTAGLTYDGSNLLLTGDIGKTGTRITKAWLVDLEVTNDITIGGTALAAIYEPIITGADTLVMFFDGANTPGSEAGFTYIKGTDTLNVVNIVCTAISGTLTGTASVAASGDAAVDFFGAGVDAVTDTTECTDIEGNYLSIAGTTLNVVITGTDTHVMFFDGANAPAGDAGLTYAKATDILTVGGLVIDGTNAKGIEITGANATAQLYIGGTNILADGEQAIYVDCPSEDGATNGIWVNLGSTVVTGDLTGARIKATSNAASGGDADTGVSVKGVYGQAICAASKHAGLLMGGLFTANVAAGSCTVFDVWVLMGHYGAGADTVIGGDLYVGYLVAQTRSTDPWSITGNSSLLALENEAVEGNGAVIDSAIRIFDTNVAAAGFTYGIDMIDSVIATADIRLSQGETIKNTVDGIIEFDGEIDFGANSVGFTLQTTTGDGSTTIDWRLGLYFKFTHGDMAETFAFTAPTNPCHMTLMILEDGNGAHDCDWPVAVTWLGAEPTWTDGGADKTMVVALAYDGTTYWAQGTPWEE